MRWLLIFLTDQAISHVHSIILLISESSMSQTQKLEVVETGCRSFISIQRCLSSAVAPNLILAGKSMRALTHALNYHDTVLYSGLRCIQLWKSALPLYRVPPGSTRIQSNSDKHNWRSKTLLVLNSVFISQFASFMRCHDQRSPGNEIRRLNQPS
jgi:hypothetical protein